VPTNVWGLNVCSEPGSGTAPNPGDPNPGDPNPGNNPDPAPAPDPGPTTGPDTSAPQVSILSPTANGVSDQAFTLEAKITDDRGVVAARLYIDGTYITEKPSAPWAIPLKLKDGYHTLRVVARDAAGNEGSAEVAITVGAGGVAPTPSPDPGSDPNLGTYGDVCGGPSDCRSGLCAHDGTANRRFCTQRCDVATLPCPGGSVCYGTTGGSAVCAPTSGGGFSPTPGAPAPPSGGGASNANDIGYGGCTINASAASAAGSFPMLTLLALLGAFAVVRKRLLLRKPRH
jgi:hypothetical protein